MQREVFDFSLGFIMVYSTFLSGDFYIINLKTTQMKTTNHNTDNMDVVRYTIVGLGILGIITALVVFELAK